MKVLKQRSDHGGEFENESFETFCTKHGIVHELSSPTTPQKNRVVERKNRSLQEMVRTMIHENNLAKHFWAKAVNIAYELFRGRKPNISYFHQLGQRHTKCIIQKHNVLKNQCTSNLMTKSLELKLQN